MATRGSPQAGRPPGKAWPNPKITNELAKRVGIGKYFWEDWSESLDYMLEPAGLTWQKFRDEVECWRPRASTIPTG